MIPWVMLVYLMKYQSLEESSELDSPGHLPNTVTEVASNGRVPRYWLEVVGCEYIIALDTGDKVIACVAYGVLGVPYTLVVLVISIYPEMPLYCTLRILLD